MRYTKTSAINFFLTLLLMILPASVDGGVIIDDFTTGTFEDPLTLATPIWDHLDSGSMLNGMRRAYNTRTAVPVSTPNAAVSVANGEWSLTGARGGIEQVRVSWGRDGSQNPVSTDAAMNLDFGSIEPFFEFDVSSVEINSQISLRVWSGLNENNIQSGSVQSVFPATSTTLQTIRVNFSEFTDVDFLDVDGISLVLDFPTNDISISEIRAGVAPVPEPTSLEVLVGASVFLLWRRNSRR